MSPPIRAALFAAACALVVWLSLMPAETLPRTGVWDKAEHALSYLGLALLGAWAFRSGRWRLALGLVAMGVGLEILQAAMGWGRSGDPLDATANTLGVVAGLGLVFAWRRLRR